MSSFSQTLYQIVFSTKYRKKTLLQNRPKIFRAMRTICQKYKCEVYAINGVEDHVHLALKIPPTIAPCVLVQKLKIESNRFIKQNNICPEFEAWQRRYSIFTYHIDSKERLVGYIKNQEKHHQKTPFEKEIAGIIRVHKLNVTDQEMIDFLNE